MHDSLAEQLKGLTMPDKLHAARHATALKIAAPLHRLERLVARLQNAALSAAVKELHDAMADAVLEHGPELGLAKVDQYSGGLPK